MKDILARMLYAALSTLLCCLWFYELIKILALITR